MKIQENVEFQSEGIVEIVKKQDLGPYFQCRGVDELLREYPMRVSRDMAILLFNLGYIEGKRAERARRRVS